MRGTKSTCGDEKYLCACVLFVCFMREEEMAYTHTHTERARGRRRRAFALTTTSTTTIGFLIAVGWDGDDNGGETQNLPIVYVYEHRSRKTLWGERQRATSASRTRA